MNNKTILFAFLAATIVLSITGLNMVEAQANQNTTTKQKMTNEQEIVNTQIDDIAKQIIDLQIDDQQKGTRDNTEQINSLMAQLEELSPLTPTKYIAPELKQKMKDAQHRITSEEGSHLPIYAVGIESETGLLKIRADSTTNIDQEIQAFVGEDIPLSIEYGPNTFKFQSSDCTGSGTASGPCNPIIGGAFSEDGYWGKDCTVSIAAVRTAANPDEDGIVIPKHCNPTSGNFYQADNDVSAELVGTPTATGGSDCDCEFIKSNSRSIDTSKIYLGGGTDITTSGNADLADETYVWLWGATTGFDSGRIKEVDQSAQIPANSGDWYDNLYFIDSISYTDGDSGAPVVASSNTKYGGMNIGTDGTYQVAHEWSYMKSQLGLQ
ncbi:hypothetical protein [Nitrosopumilus sp.]|uniref:hypothetical protein n=1 Tax=Nitrosopumilus sp. TaxID=2024843 RepID=UPI0034A001A1